MSADFDRLLAHVDACVASRDFWRLWRSIAGGDVGEFSMDALSRQETDAASRLYDLVYMGQPDAPSASEQQDGLVGGEAMWAKIVRWRSTQARVPSA